MAHQQDRHAAHGLCYEDRHENGSTWWWDIGVRCKHPEWHIDD